MPPFERDAWGREDLALLQNGAVHLFWRAAVLEAAVESMRELGYLVTTMNAAAWASETDMHAAFAHGFSFPDYYGRNLNALNDCLSDVAAFDYGASPDSAGTLLVLNGFNRFHALEPRAAHIVLDIWAGNSRLGMLFGHRMLCFVQSDDPTFELEPVGATAVHWNPAEWSYKARGIEPTR